MAIVPDTPDGDAASVQSQRPTLLEGAELSGNPTRIRAGVPAEIKNEVFEGKVLLFVRPPDLPLPKPPTVIRWFEVQLQGRFLKTIDFVMGLELSETLKLSLFLRGVGSTFVSFVKNSEPDLHTSFGVTKGDEVELPHIVTPMFKGCDAVIETIDGTGPPPALGSDFIAPGPKRPKSERPQFVRTDATYTLTTFSTFIDLTSWKIRGLPMMPSVDMANYFKDAGVRVVMYQPNKSGDAPRKDKSHSQSEKQYVLNLQLDPPHRRVQPTATPDPDPASTSELAAAPSPKQAKRISGEECGTSSAAGRGLSGSFRRKGSASPVSGLSLALAPASRKRPSKESDAAATEASVRAAADSSDAPTEARGSSSSSPSAAGDAGVPASAVPAPAVPAAPPRIVRIQSEGICKPPLFRHAIGTPATQDQAQQSAAEARAAQLEEEAAQQRLLMWMAGTQPKMARGHRRQLSDPASSRPPASRPSWRERWFGKRFKSRSSSSVQLAQGGSTKASVHKPPPARVPAYLSLVDGLPDM